MARANAANNKNAAAAAAEQQPPQPTPAAAETVAAVEAAPATPTAANDDAVSRLTAITTIAHTLSSTVRELVAALKALQKDVARLQKEVDRRPAGKGGRRAAAAAGKEAGDAAAAARHPSGFAKPTLVTKELCDFLGLSEDTKLARTEVTRLLTKYIKDNDLQDKNDRRTILADPKLSSVLRLSPGDTLTYFNLQNRIKHLFVRDVPAAPVQAVSA
jgi:chromatin remodeling complex protein RSC6